MGTPDPERQVQFLFDVQRLISDGSFVATLKFALLLALADLAVERGDDTTESLPLDTLDVAEKRERVWNVVATATARPTATIINTGDMATPFPGRTARSPSRRRARRSPDGCQSHANARLPRPPYFVSNESLVGVAYPALAVAGRAWPRSGRRVHEDRGPSARDEPGGSLQPPARPPRRGCDQPVPSMGDEWAGAT